MMKEFKQLLAQSKSLVVLTGAGVSAESGIPTFIGAGGFWRSFKSETLATPEAFAKSPSLVWEFYHYRRELVLTKKPNAAHLAIAACEKKLMESGRKFTLITQNVDELHRVAGSENIVELHGSLFKTRCLKCGEVKNNRNSPICEALRGKGAPDASYHESILVENLPHCDTNDCNGLLRPHIVWFGESLHEDSLLKTEEAMLDCDLCIIVGTSSVVWPAASFGPRLARKGVPVAEFNLESTEVTPILKFHFEGNCSVTIPKALSYRIDIGY